jgi:uncharacterized protein YjdB
MFVLKSDLNYNLPVITDQISKLMGVHDASVNHSIGDGDDITAIDSTDHIDLIYKLGWDDCMAGCISNRYFKFRVYLNYSVEFIGSYGDLLPIHVKSVSIDHPNIITTIGKTSIQLLATVLPQNSTNKQLYWSSSQPSVATVNQSGLVTLVSNGQAIISVQSEDGNFKVTSNITVESSTGISDAMNQHLSVSPNPFIDVIEIKSGVGKYQYFIYNMNGQELLNGISKANDILNLQSLASGEFILLLKSEKETSSFKLIKK